MTRRPDTGDRGLALLARLDPDKSPRELLQELLTKHGGNGTRAARELGLAEARSLMATVDALGLRGWLDELREKLQ